MLEYREKRCSFCNGIGTVRFLLLFSRTCPDCYGTGTVRIPQFSFKSFLKKSKSVSSPSGNSKPMFVSELTPKTRTIVKKYPQLLSALSLENKTTLLSKYKGDLRSVNSILLDSTRQKRQQQLKLGGAMRRQQQYYQGLARQRQQNQQQFQNFINQSIQQHQNFHNWSQQQHQNWANQQFQNFANQFPNFGR